MSDFLTNLAARSLNIANAVQPRPQSMFERVDTHEPLPPESDAAEHPASPSEHPPLPTTDAVEVAGPVRTRERAASPREAPSQVSVRRLEREELRAPEVSSHRATAATSTHSNLADELPTPSRSTKSAAPPQAPASQPTPAHSPMDTSVTPHERTPPQPHVERVTSQTTQASHKRSPPEDSGVTASTTQPVVTAGNSDSDLESASTAFAQTQPSSAATPESVPELTAGDLLSVSPIHPALTAAAAPKTGLPTSGAEAASVNAVPTVQVTIGRIDVRAVSAVPEAAPVKKKRREPALSLDDYARQRSGGR